MTTELEQLQLATQEIAFDALDGAELGFDSDSDSREDDSEEEES